VSAQQVKKLEALLARVQERAAEPRVSSVAAPAAPVAAAPVVAAPVVAAAAPVAAPAAPAVVVAPALVAVPPPRSSAPMVSEPEPSVIIEDDDAPPTPAGEDLVAAHAQPKTPEAPEVEITEDDGDAEVSAEMVEVDVDEDDLLEDGAGAQSHTQMVAAAPADDNDNDDDGGTLIQAGVRAPTVAPEGETLEEAPASSRRPAKAADPFVDEARPPQTPPPESGRQVASVHPVAAAPVRESRVPTPPPAPLASFEADQDEDEPPSHGTMVGGWREPGMPPDSVLRTDVPPAVPVAAARPASIKPETTQPAVAATGAVAVATGQAPTFAPASFGDLLDATLGL